MSSSNTPVRASPHIAQLIADISAAVRDKLIKSGSTKRKQMCCLTPPDFFTRIVTAYLDISNISHFNDELNDQKPPKNVTFEVTAAEMVKDVKELRAILEEIEAEKQRAHFYLEFAAKMGLVYVGWRLLTRRW
ncbi:hypothetical protein PRIPAC_86292 [Pristionchus pacificus]|uniref:Uncharacterized protein n=1 Tax=Pristionchus pacificus TaxID=54126 RepID=A0A2A6BUG8_PRIPA|nr:hypothetical protein PRIPAC_86292 [Pristionchus pacificus]|eukprot:PDM69401.1 hypothetical protein PRIPAC_44497 [Pristionchus pacificus]